MEEKLSFKIIDNNGIENEYEILIAFYWHQTSKNYIVYTDNKTDEEGSLNIFASIYYPEDDSRLDAILSDDEWKEIENRLEGLQN